jgi:hypothetical protein
MKNKTMVVIMLLVVSAFILGIVSNRQPASVVYDEVLKVCR